MTPIRQSFTRYDFPELIDARKFSVAAEIGVSLGEFSYYLLRFSKLKTLYSVDHYPGRNCINWKGSTSLLSEFGERSVSVKKSSLDFAKESPPLDFVYIDADHKEPNVAADIRAWFPVVKSGGILAGHDYVIDNGGVIKAVDAFAAETGLQLYLTREVWSSWYFIVP